MVTPRPAASIRGPSINPAATACAISMFNRSAAPRSRTVVNPAWSVARAYVSALQARWASGVVRAAFSSAGSPLPVRWTWQSMSPGMMNLPLQSILRAPGMLPAFSSWIWPSIAAMSARRKLRSEESKTMAPEKSSGLAAVGFGVAVVTCDHCQWGAWPAATSRIIRKCDPTARVRSQPTGPSSPPGNRAD